MQLWQTCPMLASDILVMADIPDVGFRHKPHVSGQFFCAIVPCAWSRQNTAAAAQFCTCPAESRFTPVLSSEHPAINSSSGSALVINFDGVLSRHEFDIILVRKEEAAYCFSAKQSNLFLYPHRNLCSCRSRLSVRTFSKPPQRMASSGSACRHRVPRRRTVARTCHFAENRMDQQAAGMGEANSSECRARKQSSVGTRQVLQTRSGSTRTLLRAASLRISRGRSRCKPESWIHSSPSALPRVLGTVHRP